MAQLADRGVPPRPWRNAAGGVEGDGAGIARRVGHWLGQLELESGLSVRLGTLRYQPEPQHLPELPPSTRGQALHHLGFAFKCPKKRLVKADEAKREAFVAEYAALWNEAYRSGAKIFFADEAHFRADAELRGKWVLRGEPAPRFHGGRLWWTRAARATARRPATIRRFVWRRARACPRESGGRMDGTGGKQQLRNLGGLPEANEAEALRSAEGDLGQRAGAPWRGGSGVPSDAGPGTEADEPPFSRGQALPGYSPDFNPDEAVWGWAREEATGNLCLGTKSRVQERIGNFLAGLNSRKEEVKRRCRTVLQSRAEKLLRDSQPHCQSLPNAHPTLALV